MFKGNAKVICDWPDNIRRDIESVNDWEIELLPPEGDVNDYFTIVLSHMINNGDSDDDHSTIYIDIPLIHSIDMVVNMLVFLDQQIDNNMEEAISNLRSKTRVIDIINENLNH